MEIYCDLFSGGGNLKGIYDLPPEKSGIDEPVDGRRQDHVIRRQCPLALSFRDFQLV